MASAFSKGLSGSSKDAAKAAQRLKTGGRGAKLAAKKAKAPVKDVAQEPWQLQKAKENLISTQARRDMADEFYRKVESNMSARQAAGLNEMWYEEFGAAGDGRKVTHVFFARSKGRGERIYLLEDSNTRVCKVLQAGGHWDDGHTNSVLKSAKKMKTTRV